MPESYEEYVSVIGNSLLHPIVTLMEALEAHNPKGTGELQTSSLENGYSVAVIVLVVLLLESALNRTQYVQGKSPPENTIKFFQAAFPSSGLSEELEELFVIRDVIVHNHIWFCKFNWEEEGIKLISSQILPGYGDKKFNKIIDPQLKKTKKLGLNLVPTKICYFDAIAVLKWSYEILAFLEKRDRKYVYPSTWRVEYKGEYIKLQDFIEKIEEAKS